MRDTRRFWVGLLLLTTLAATVAVMATAPATTFARDTALLCAATVAISLPVGSLLAFFVVRTDLPGRRLVGWLLGCLLFVPLYVQAAAWEAGFGLQGAVTLGLETGVWLEGFRAAVWVHAMAAAPWTALLVGAGLWLVERELEEVALLDASAGRVVLIVTMRRGGAAFAAAALWVAVVTAGEMTVTDLFQVRTYAEQLYVETALGGTLGEAPLAMLPSILVVAWLVAAALLLCTQLVSRFPLAGAGRPHVFHLGRWRWPCAGMVGGIMAIVAGVPLASLFYKAGVVVTQTETGRVRTWSLWRCLKTVFDAIPAFWQEIGWTLATGCLAASVALVVAVALAWWARAARAAALPAVIITAALLAVPGPLVGMAVIWLLGRNDPAWMTAIVGAADGGGLLYALYNHPLVALPLVQCARALPLATLVCWAAFRTIPVESLHIAATSGAGPSALLCKVAIPQRKAALAAAWLVAFALAVGELAAGVLVAPPGVTTLSIQIFNQLHYGAESQVAGVCLALLTVYAAIGLATALAINHFARRQG